jgi:glycerol-3-phosphate acyltransferase PlsY
VNAILLGILAVAIAYLVGAIPFGYVTFYLVRGADIRTVGSGNIGATNAGRQLGFRYFVLVFLLDMGKGFLPTWGLPLAVKALTGSVPPELPVFTALATILGHNFPIYLKFHGGKGVATSFGALLALDWAASLASVCAFLVTFLITRVVSVGSMAGGIFFLLVYTQRAGDPWSRDHLAMTIFTIAIVILLFFRHRKNIIRILNGTEPRVSFRKKRPPEEPTSPAEDTAPAQ